jgi:endoglucanase
MPIQFVTQDNGVPLLAKWLEVQASSPAGGSIATPAAGTFPLYSGPSSNPRDPANPRALTATPPPGNPLAGARFYLDSDNAATHAANALLPSDPRDAMLLARIGNEPYTTRFGAWDGPNPGQAAASFLSRVAGDPWRSVPLLSTYRIISGQCHRGDDTMADAAGYHTWIKSLAEGIGTHPAVLFLEMDSLITTPCLSPTGLAIRLAELRDAVSVLSDCPHLLVYLDAGAADALPAARAAALLRAAGVAQTQGFFLNSTHFDWTSREIAYGEKISRLTGGKHFVINTAENGRGPLVPRNRRRLGNEILCNPYGRGLGPLPGPVTTVPNLDAFAWIANPGVSGGRCRPGAPKTGVFWPALAAELARNADFQVR